MGPRKAGSSNPDSPWDLGFPAVKRRRCFQAGEGVSGPTEPGCGGNSPGSLAQAPSPALKPLSFPILGTRGFLTPGAGARNAGLDLSCHGRKYPNGDGEDEADGESGTKIWRRTLVCVFVVAVHH